MSKGFSEIKSRVYEAPKNDRQIKTLVEEAKAVCKQLDEVKPLYNRRDQIIKALLPVQHKLPKFGCYLEDAFKSEITAFKKTTAFTRYLIKWSSDDAPALMTVEALLAALKNLDNKDGSIPKKIWKMRNDAIEQAEGKKKSKRGRK